MQLHKRTRRRIRVVVDIASNLSKAREHSPVKTLNRHSLSPGGKMLRNSHLRNLSDT